MCFKFFSKNPDQKIESIERNASFDDNASLHSEDESLASLKDLEAAYASVADSPTANASSNEKTYVSSGTETREKNEVRNFYTPPQRVTTYTGSLVLAVVPLKAARALGLHLYSPFHKPAGYVTSPIPNEIPRKAGEVLGIPPQFCRLEERVQLRRVCDELGTDEGESVLSELESGKEELSN